VKSSPENPNFLGLRTAIYHAPDLAKGKAWYSKILGIEPYFDQPFYVGFNIGGYELGLDPDPSASGGSGGVVVYWGVTDANAALKRLLSLGATEVQTFRTLVKESASRRFSTLSATYSE
jgi:predicted enzyme related to lactoylglutathione lyase